MNYAIIGFGKGGQALAKAVARKGFEVAIASRRPAEGLAPVAKAIGPTIIPKSLQDAVKSDVILLAMPLGTQKGAAKAAEIGQDVHAIAEGWRKMKRHRDAALIPHDKPAGQLV